jgi:hypothetical protein
MPSLPESEVYLLVRTYFGDDQAWAALRKLIEEGSDDEFYANVEYVDDHQFDGFSPEALEAIHPHRSNEWDVMYVADQRSLSEPAHPLLVVRVGSSEDLPFRCRADLLYEVDANLSLANLDWDDFRDDLDESGVYGGVEAAVTPEPQPYIDPAVAAYRAASKQRIEISFPMVPTNLWARIWNDLREAPLHMYGPGRKEVLKISGRIAEWDYAETRVGPGDQVFVSLRADEWAFIKERTRRLESRPAESHDGRAYGPVAREIVDLISRHLE